MPPTATVTGCNLTPVKSTALHRPDAIDLRREGAVGDRRFLFARADGTRLSGVSKAPLMTIASAWDRDGERLTLRFPDGTVVEEDAGAAGPPVEVALYDRSVTARPVDPAFADPVRAIDETLALLRVDEPEFAGGTSRVSVVSRASVADVGGRGGDAELDPRRFRMLIEVDGVEPYGEDAWVGRALRVGGAVIRLARPMPRCVMTTLDPDTGVPDFPTLDVLASHRQVGAELRLGVVGDVLKPGVVHVGDEMAFA